MGKVTIENVVPPVCFTNADVMTHLLPSTYFCAVYVARIIAPSMSLAHVSRSFDPSPPLQTNFNFQSDF